MSDQTVKSLLGDPPEEFGTSFFTWVEQTQEAAAITVVDISDHPIPEEDLHYIEAIGECSIPSDIRTYYQYCSPWGIWQNPRDMWEKTLERVYTLLKNDSHIIPIDINSQQGNILVAQVVSDAHYRLIFIDRYNETSECGKNIRKYIVDNLINEIIV